MPTYKSNNGFTLVELSIAIVIIALVIGSIYAGSALIRNSEMNSFYTEAERYNQAINSFETVYGALPGDFYSPEVVWAGNPSPNGNGDGMINWQDEGYAAWLQLKLANLISGNFTGLAGAGSSAIIGENVPASKRLIAGYSFYFLSATDAATEYALSTEVSPAILSGNYLALGANNANSYTNGAAISAIEAAAVDFKFDDGKADFGNILGSQNSSSRCFALEPDGSGGNRMVYDSSTGENITCNLYFKIK